jgi:hypothetical protein
MADEKWHPEQDGKWPPDGRYELRIPYQNPRELVMHIMRHGANVEVVTPPDLRNEVQEQLRRALSYTSSRRPLRQGHVLIWRQLSIRHETRSLAPQGNAVHKSNGRIHYSATDLIGFLECEHLTTLELLNLEGPLPSTPEDEQVALIQQKGHEHDRTYVEELHARIPGFVGISQRGWDIGFTIEAMRSGVEVIYQVVLEVVDTKFTRSEKTQSITQLGFYSQCWIE